MSAIPPAIHVQLAQFLTEKALPHTVYETTWTDCRQSRSAIRPRSRLWAVDGQTGS
jgi:hypothetical protein